MSKATSFHRRQTTDEDEIPWRSSDIIGVLDEYLGEVLSFMECPCKSCDPLRHVMDADYLELPPLVQHGALESTCE